jgi:nucleoside-diphosphate-sugar epimerase
MADPAQTPIIILGGRSLVAPALFQLLATAGLTATVISRRELALPPGFTAQQLDLTQARQWVVPENAIVISLLPLWITARHVNRMMGAQALIAISSTSRFSKTSSVDPKERQLAENLELAENIISGWAPRSHVAYTILRPTLIYDGHTDQNVTKMARFIRRFGFFPVAAPAKGLRQPIHAEDVAKAIMGALGNAAAYNQAFNIAGGEVLTYRQMVERVFAALGLNPRILALPLSLLELPFRLAKQTGLFKDRHIGFGVFQRMNEDLVFDVADGVELLRYEPRSFLPEFSTNLRH